MSGLTADALDRNFTTEQGETNLADVLQGVADAADRIATAISQDAMPHKDEFGVVASLTEAVMRHGDQTRDGLLEIADAIREARSK